MKIWTFIFWGNLSEGGEVVTRRYQTKQTTEIEAFEVILRRVKTTLHNPHLSKLPSSSYWKEGDKEPISIA